MRMTFGRYIPTQSIIHKMDPRLKLLALVIMIVSIFFPIGFTGYIVLGTVVMGSYLVAKLPLRMLFKLTTPVILIFIILLVVNILLAYKLPDNITQTTGQYDDLGYFVQFKIGSYQLVLSEASVYNAVFMSLRIFLMITVTTIITSTTQPLELSIAIEDLLWPLRLVGLPVQILAMIISVALRMIPTLIDEAGRIIKAQSSRGIDVKNGKFRDKIKGMTSLIIPLLVSAFQRADDLANAMDARGYDPKAKRTRYRQVGFRFLDVVIFVFFIAIAGGLIAYSFLAPTSSEFLHIPHIDVLLRF